MSGATPVPFVRKIRRSPGSYRQGIAIHFKWRTPDALSPGSTCAARLCVADHRRLPDRHGRDAGSGHRHRPDVHREERGAGPCRCRRAYCGPGIGWDVRRNHKGAKQPRIQPKPVEHGDIRFQWIANRFRERARRPMGDEPRCPWRLSLRQSQSHGCRAALLPPGRDFGSHFCHNREGRGSSAPQDGVSGRGVAFFSVCPQQRPARFRLYCRTALHATLACRSEIERQRLLWR